MFSRQPNPIHHPAIIDGCRVHGKLGFTTSTCAKSTFSHEHNILPWDVVYFECFGDDFFRLAVGVEICLLAIVSILI
jgi:hypothetical protein